MRPAMCSPFRREFSPPYLHLDAVPRLPCFAQLAQFGIVLGADMLGDRGGKHDRPGWLDEIRFGWVLPLAFVEPVLI